MALKFQYIWFRPFLVSTTENVICGSYSNINYSSNQEIIIMKTLLMNI